MTIKANYPASSGKATCLGSLSLADKASCTSKTIALSTIGAPSVWRLSQVKTGVHTISAASRGTSCLKYLGATAKCSDGGVTLYAKDDGIGQQRYRWAITLAKPAPPPKPKPAPVQKKPPPPSAVVTPVQVVSYSIGMTGFTTATFGAAQKASFCESVVSSIQNYPKRASPCHAAVDHHSLEAWHSASSLLQSIINSF